MNNTAKRLKRGCESVFKGFARAMRAAVELDLRKGGAVPSTKGQLGG